MNDAKNHMVRIQDEELFTRAKIYAATSGMTLIEITEKALKQYFSKKMKKGLDAHSNM